MNCHFCDSITVIKRPVINLKLRNKSIIAVSKYGHALCHDKFYEYNI